MKYVVLILLFTSGLYLKTFAQSPDMKVIKQRADKEYNLLAERFARIDTTLKLEDLQVLYYGFTHTKGYKPDEIILTENSIREANNQAQPAKALVLADSLLSIYPASIVALFEKSFAYAALGLPDKEFQSNTMYKAILKTILRSGDGSSVETAYVINTPNDEFDIIRYFDFTATRYDEIGYNGKTYDILTVKKNKLKVEKVFFDITNYAAYKEMQQIESLKK